MGYVDRAIGIPQIVCLSVSSDETQSATITKPYNFFQRKAFFCNRPTLKIFRKLHETWIFFSALPKMEAAMTVVVCY